MPALLRKAHLGNTEAAVFLWQKYMVQYCSGCFQVFTMRMLVYERGNELVCPFVHVRNAFIHPFM